MTLKGMLDRRLLRLIVTPLARALISVLVGYLASKGVPNDQIEQLSIALAGLGAIAFNIGWELVDRRKAQNRAIANFIEGALPEERT